MYNKIIAIVSVLYLLVLGFAIYEDERSDKLYIEQRTELSDIRKQNLDNQIKCLQDITYLIKHVLPLLPQKEKFETGLVTVQLSMGSLEDMKKEEVAFRDHIEACSKSATAQFCVPELEEHVKVINKNNSHFLVIEKLTLPWASGICNFLWNSPDYPRWARDSNINFG